MSGERQVREGEVSQLATSLGVPDWLLHQGIAGAPTADLWALTEQLAAHRERVEGRLGAIEHELALIAHALGVAAGTTRSDPSRSRRLTAGFGPAGLDAQQLQSHEQ